MSLNHFELKRIVEQMAPLLEGQSLRQFGFVQWGGSRAVASKADPSERLYQDYLIGLDFGLTEGMPLVSLKAPWMGLFWLSHKQGGDFSGSTTSTTKGPKSSRAPWVWVPVSLLGGEHRVVYDHGKSLVGTKLDKLISRSPDRVVEFHFSDPQKGKSQLIFDLFAARPNWILQFPDRTLHWRERLSRPPLVSGEMPVRFSTLEDAWDLYGQLRQKATFEQKKADLVQIARSKLVSLKKVYTKNRGLLQDAGKAEIWNKRALALQSQLYLYPKRAKLDRILLEYPTWDQDQVGDESSPPPQGEEIRLDPQLTLTEHLQKWFQKAQKAARAKGELEGRQKEIETEIEKWQERLSKVELCQDLPSLGSLHWTVEKQTPQAPKRVQAKQEKSSGRAFSTKEGLWCLVGRSHQENRDIVMGRAHGNDLWFHLKARPGAHGVLFLPKGKSASLESLLDTACLVAHYSGVKNGEKCEVDYTFRKYVRRISGSSDGFHVTYSQNKTLVVQVDAQRLERLLKSSPVDS